MKRRQNGFTLVELIIVIAVIGVLAAILIPVFSNVVKKANAKSALADARNAVSQYVTESTEQRTRGAAVPENITILVKKGGRYYAFGFNTAATESIRVSLENENGMVAQSLDALIQNRSFNVQNGGTYDPDATYTLSDGAFYLVPYVGGVSQNTNVRGIVTVSGSDFMRLDEESAGQGFDLNVGGDTAIYHGCLVNGTYETTGAQNNAAPTSAPTATATQAPTQEPTQAPTQAPTEAPTPAQYSVTFNANGGTGEMAGTTANGSYTLPACGFTAPAHKHFTGWKANGEGDSIAVDDSYNVTTAVEFFAQWTDDPSHSVVYNKNNASATGSMTDNTAYYNGDTANVRENNFVLEGYTFKYFTLTAEDSGTHYRHDGANGASTTVSITDSAVTLYAQWQINSYTVTFTDGTNSQNKNYNYNTTITLADENPLTAPSGKELDKFTVGGADATTLTVTANTTVTVVWKDVATAPSEPVVENPVLIIRFVDYDLKGSTSVSQEAIKADCYDGHEGDFKEYRFASLPTSDGNLGWDSTGKRIKIDDTAEETLKVTFAGYNWPYVGNTAATQSKKYGIYNNDVFSTSINALKTQLNAVKEGDVWVWYITVKELPSASPNIIIPSAILPVPYEDR